MACSASSSTALLSYTSRASISPKSHISQSISVPSAFNGLRNCNPLVSRVARSINTRVAQAERRRFAVCASVSFSRTPFCFAWFYCILS